MKWRIGFTFAVFSKFECDQHNAAVFLKAAAIVMRIAKVG